MSPRIPSSTPPGRLHPLRWWMVPFLVMAAWPLSGWATSREASGGSAPVRVEVRCHVFQSVRDAPLVPGKPTVIRVYADWEAKDGPVEQPELLDATVRIRAGGRNWPRCTRPSSGRTCISAWTV